MYKLASTSSSFLVMSLSPTLRYSSRGCQACIQAGVIPLACRHKSCGITVVFCPNLITSVAVRCSKVFIFCAPKVDLNLDTTAGFFAFSMLTREYPSLSTLDILLRLLYLLLLPSCQSRRSSLSRDSRERSHADGAFLSSNHSSFTANSDSSGVSRSR